MKLLPYIPITLFFLFLGFTACNQKQVENKEPQILSEDYVNVVIYDSCEYIVAGAGTNRWGSHKGNCKNPIHKNDTIKN